MFKKVLIANRGAIAVRIIRTLQQLGIGSVAVYASADADSLHVELADEAWCLGAGAAATTYLDQQRLLQIAAAAGADAVHPGYGFVSENADFVERCERRGLAFIGPTAQQIRTFGLKHRARELAQRLQLPLLPGSALLHSVDDALAAAAAIGYPVILKSTAGGGGIGMQLCRGAAQLREAFDSVRRLSANNFADDGVFVEKYIEFARHLEVQIFGDGDGRVIAVGERDCSTQRRHQKVIEEAPAPDIPPAVRRALHQVAVRLGAAINYRSAGTVEFIYDRDTQQFWFLEVNTRLQVEHGVTEQVYAIDLVAWMIALAAGELQPLASLEAALEPRGHAIQVRLYAEDPNKDFQPSAGLLTEVELPAAAQRRLRVDSWIRAGVELAPLFDPMLAKLIGWGQSRAAALTCLRQGLDATRIAGIETNRDYLAAILASREFGRGAVHTRFLRTFRYRPETVDILAGGTQTTVQDYPGRCGYWDVGVPPSGPFDSYAFRLANRLLGNDDSAAGLEMALDGPSLRFNCATRVVFIGADVEARLDRQPLAAGAVTAVGAGQVLRFGRLDGAGARAYLALAGGIRCPLYLGSRATFILGRFGGHGGRALRTGDVLHLAPAAETAGRAAEYDSLPPALYPRLSHRWQLRVIYGPHGAPDFFTAADIQTFFASDWEVHYNSSRTGVRLLGPRPQWARSDGGEAGLHPSNIHDNAYAIGTVDFTGDMPVILGPDGPSLGGFVCPATVISADLWMLGQLQAGDKLRFVPVSIETAVALERAQRQSVATLAPVPVEVAPAALRSPVLKRLSAAENGVEVCYRPAGDKYLLLEYGPPRLDLALRFRVHAIMLWLQRRQIDGVLELTPGIRSLQVHYDSLELALPRLLEILQCGEKQLRSLETMELPARIVHLPLSWDDDTCRQAVEKYTQSVRKGAPWCPDNIEFIRRINGLDSVEAVKDIVFGARYVVMGLGDVYLGAPVATPLDPRQRLVTTKYNPARTWTAENAVGIGGSYLCIYGMEGPGGYQLLGRTLQMWNRYRSTAEFQRPWLLRAFDQIQFYPVSAAELARIREDFPKGRYPLRIEQTHFSLPRYREFLAAERVSIERFNRRRRAAFDAELQRWRERGQLHYQPDGAAAAVAARDCAAPLAPGCIGVDSHVAGSLWQWRVDAGDRVAAGQGLALLECMKMELELTAPAAGRVESLLLQPGDPVSPGQRLLILAEEPAPEEAL